LKEEVGHAFSLLVLILKIMC